MPSAQDVAVVGVDSEKYLPHDVRRAERGKPRGRHISDEKLPGDDSRAHDERQSTLIADLVGIAIAAFIWAMNPIDPTKPPKGDAQAKQGTFRDPLVLATFAIFFATLVTAVVAGLQWCALRQAEATNQSIQRAFVFPKIVIFEHVNDNNQVVWRFIPVWENTGSTPTDELRLYPYCGVNPIDVSPPFKSEFSHPQGAVERIIGPKQTTTGGRCTISNDDFMKLKRHETFLYAGGQAIYYDVFNHRHVTRFCYEYESVLNDALPANSDAEAVLGRPLLCYADNCADEQCDQQDAHGDTRENEPPPRP